VIWYVVVRRFGAREIASQRQKVESKWPSRTLNRPGVERLRARAEIKVPYEGILPLSYDPQNKGSIGIATANVQTPTTCAGDNHNRWNRCLASDRLMERFSWMGQIRPVDLELAGSLGRVNNPEDLGGTPVRIASAHMEKAIGSALRRGTLCIKEVPHNARGSRLSLDPGNAREVPWPSLIHRRGFTRGW